MSFNQTLKKRRKTLNCTQQSTDISNNGQILKTCDLNGLDSGKTCTLKMDELISHMIGPPFQNAIPCTNENTHFLQETRSGHSTKSFLVQHENFNVLVMKFS